MQLDVLEKRLSDLEATMDKVESLNAENTKDIKELDIALAKQQYIDSNQVGAIARLLSAAQNVQTQLLIVRGTSRDLTQSLCKRVNVCMSVCGRTCVGLYFFLTRLPWSCHQLFIFV